MFNELNLTWLFSVIAAIMLFLHGLSSFSSELTEIGGQRLREFMQKLTRSDLRGVFFGSISTSVVQSSSAVSSIAIGLAHNQTFSYRAAFTVMIGANIGSTLTAWLVAFKITGLGPVFITFGGLWSIVGPRPFRAYGKPLFYFGIIFLALDLISHGLSPLSQSDSLIHWQKSFEHPAYALIFGAILTAVVQSSSVVSGVAVLSVAQGIIHPALAVWMVVGANVGTTSTALLASSSMNRQAVKLAILNTGFNVFGLIVFALLLQPLVSMILASTITSSQQVALVHTTFNITAGVLALLILPKTWPYLEYWINPKEKVAL